MATIKCTTKGVETIVKNYDSYDKNVQKRVRKVVAKSITNIFNDVKSAAPRGRTGNLQSRIRKSMSRKTLSGVVKSRAPHSYIVEHGTKPHDIRPKKRKVLAILGQILTPEVRHPGSRPRPFVKPAFYKERPSYVNNLKEAIRDGK